MKGIEDLALLGIPGFREEVNIFFELRRTLVLGLEADHILPSRVVLGNMLVVVVAIDQKSVLVVFFHIDNFVRVLVTVGVDVFSLDSREVL